MESERRGRHEHLQVRGHAARDLHGIQCCQIKILQGNGGCSVLGGGFRAAVHGRGGHIQRLVIAIYSHILLH